MTYDLIEASTAEGRPYYLYHFIEGEQIWRFTSRASDWISAASEYPTHTHSSADECSE